VNPDCTGTITVTNGNQPQIHLQMVVAESGKKIHEMVIDPGVRDHVRRGAHPYFQKIRIQSGAHIAPLILSDLDTCRNIAITLIDL